MSLIYAAILPHGPGVIAELTDCPALMATTRDAMAEAGRRFAAATPDVVVLLDPNAVHEAQTVAIAEVARGVATRFPALGSDRIALHTAEFAAGGLSGPDGRSAHDRYRGDPAFARRLLDAADGLPVSVCQDEPRLVGGALIPLWFTLRALPEPRPGLVVVDAGPAVPRAALWRFGERLAAVAAESGRRVALLASADQGHTHAPAHPRFGYSRAAAEHDAWYCRAVAEQRLDRLLEADDELLRRSWTDSLWQTLTLGGAVTAAGLRGELLSYAVPTYFGMAVATYAPAGG